MRRRPRRSLCPSAIASGISSLSYLFCSKTNIPEAFGMKLAPVFFVLIIFTILHNMFALSSYFYDILSVLRLERLKILRQERRCYPFGGRMDLFSGKLYNSQGVRASNRQYPAKGGNHNDQEVLYPVFIYISVLHYTRGFLVCRSSGKVGSAFARHNLHFPIWLSKYVWPKVSLW